MWRVVGRTPNARCLCLFWAGSASVLRLCGVRCSLDAINNGGAKDIFTPWRTWCLLAEASRCCSMVHNRDLRQLFYSTLCLMGRHMYLVVLSHHASIINQPSKQRYVLPQNKCHSKTKTDITLAAAHRPPGAVLSWNHIRLLLNPLAPFAGTLDLWSI